MCLFIHCKELHTGEVSDVCCWILFGRDCKDGKYKDLKLKSCGQRVKL